MLFKSNNPSNSWWSRVLKRWTILIVYLLIIIISSVLMIIPGVVHNSRQSQHLNFSWNWWISFFNCSSAISDTGLEIGSLSDNYSIAGQIITFILIFVGGLGWSSIQAFILVFLRKELNTKLTNQERGDANMSKSKNLIKCNVIFLVCFQLGMATVLWIMFYFSKPSSNPEIELWNNPYHRVGQSFWTGLFSSVSATNNAGFDILGAQSFMPYRQVYWVTAILLFEFIVGGLGFITLFDLGKCIRTRQGQWISWFSKINLITYALLSILGVTPIIITEMIHTNLPHNNQGDLFWNSFFNTMSCRSAGFSTVDITQFQNGSRIIQIWLMFIGGAPASASGGIRTITWAVLCAHIWSHIRKLPNPILWKKNIKQENIQKAINIFLFSVTFIILMTVIISYCFPSIAVIDHIYLLVSAFGTVGLDPGLNSHYMTNLRPATITTIFMLCWLMILGQLGVGNFLDAFIFPSKKSKLVFQAADLKLG